MKYICTSDIHLGHLNTPTEHIIDSFVKTILTPTNKDIDILYIAGDLFDHLLYLNTKEAQRIVQFFHRLLNYCYQNDIQLRVLEGTPSHDWYQSAMLTKINDVRQNKVDLLYFKTLEIEYNKRHNLHVLYIPDEWCNSDQELHSQIQAKLSERSITQVDTCILHGAFKYQAQAHPSSAYLYDEDYFLSLTRGFIHIGHYHTYNPLDRILPNGSLERLAHGEEGDKGYILVNDTNYTFIPNPHATIYKTIELKDSDTDPLKLDKKINKLPPESHVRLIMPDHHPFSQAFKDVKLRYPNHHLKKLSKKAASDKNTNTYIELVSTLEVSEHLITQANIYQTLIELTTTKYDLSPSDLTKLIEFASILKDTTHDQPTAEPA